MKLAQKIGDAYRTFARRRADRKLVRELQRQMPEMMAEMDQMVAGISKAHFSFGEIVAEAKKYDHVITMPAPEPLLLPVILAPPPFDTDDCTVLKKPMSIRQPLRMRKAQP